LIITLKMVFFAALMMWAYTVNEYKVPGARKTSIWRPLWDRCVYVLSIGKLLVSDSFLASITVSAQ
jgi:hypothetical protein